MTSKLASRCPVDVNNDQVEKGVCALQTYIEKKNEEKGVNLLDEPESVHLQFTFHKVVPDFKKTIKILLPWSLATDKSDVCLLVSDKTKQASHDYSKTVHHYEELLQKKGVTNITKILPLRELMLEYRPFEAKRNLATLHDTFLADSRIMLFLPALLGKAFLGRNKYPILVNVRKRNLKREVSNALSTTLCVLQGRGSCFQVKIGHTRMTSTQLVENLMTAFAKIACSIPGGHQNLKSAHMKTTKSPALPFYFNEGTEDIKLPKLKKKRGETFKDDTLLDDGFIHVTSEGLVTVQRKNQMKGGVDADSDSDLEEETRNPWSKRSRKNRSGSDKKKSTAVRQVADKASKRKNKKSVKVVPRVKKDLPIIKAGKQRKASPPTTARTSPNLTVEEPPTKQTKLSTGYKGSKSHSQKSHPKRKVAKRK